MSPGTYQAMRKPIRSQAGSPPISLRWTWVVLAPLLAGCCRSRESSDPRELVCQPIAMFEVLEPERDAGAAPFNIERFGPEVNAAAVYIPPAYIGFSDGNIARVEWDTGTDFVMSTTQDFVYSPAEGLARNANDPSDVYPMRRFFDGKSERVWFGFRSSICREPGAYDDWVFCKRTKEKLFLVADMYCRWWINGSPPEK